jgi:hypothetical protein
MPADEAKRLDEPNIDKPIVVGSEQARGGVITGRVLTVLIVSMALAVLAMWILLAHDWR